MLRPRFSRTQAATGQRLRLNFPARSDILSHIHLSTNAPRSAPRAPAPSAAVEFFDISNRSTSRSAVSSACRAEPAFGKPCIRKADVSLAPKNPSDALAIPQPPTNRRRISPELPQSLFSVAHFRRFLQKELALSISAPQKNLPQAAIRCFRFPQFKRLGKNGNNSSKREISLESHPRDAELEASGIRAAEARVGVGGTL